MRAPAEGRVRREPDPSKIEDFADHEDLPDNKSVLRNAIRNLMDQGDPPSLDQVEPQADLVERYSDDDYADPDLEAPQGGFAEDHMRAHSEAAVPGSTVSHPSTRNRAKSQRAKTRGRADAGPGWFAGRGDL